MLAKYFSSPRFLQILWIFLIVSGLTRCGNPDVQGITTSKNDDKSVFIPKTLSYQVVAEFPHDPGAYTQGLIWKDGYFLEGTGQFGESNIRKVDLITGRVLKEQKNNEEIFGEGITCLNDKIYQITWQNKKGFVYDAKTFALIKEFSLNTEGWGLTNDGKNLIYSDGSSNLYYLDTASFRELKRVGVTDNFGPVSNLNELEWIDGLVWANRYQTDMIYRINPENGQVTGRLDLTGLKERAGFSVPDPNNEVLNGIAYDSTNKKIYITGKYWPKLFEVAVTE